MKGFTFYLTYYDIAQELGEKAQGQFYKAIADYMFSGQDPEETLPKRVRIAFKSVKANLKTSQKRSQNGTDGNAVKWGNDNVCDKKDDKQTNRKNIASSSSISISSSMSKPAQSKARGFDGHGGSGAEETAAADAREYDFIIDMDEIRKGLMA